MRYRKILICITLSIFAFSQSALAVGSAGFENAAFSARQISQSGAGSANPVEPAIISMNPAGITELDGIQVQGTGHLESVITYYSSNTVDNTHSSGPVAIIPTAYISINPGNLLGGRVALGFGSDSPFGLSAKFKSQHPISRFTGYDTWLKMYALKPVIAVKLHEKVSVGAGPMYYRIFDFGTALNYPTLGGRARLEMRGQEWGWHAGVLVKPTEKHRVSFYFRSPVGVDVTGDLKVEDSAVGGTFQTRAKSRIELPLNFTLAYAYKPSDKTTYMADFGFTRWESFQRLYVDTEPTNATDDAVINAISKQDKDYRNSYSIQLAVNHEFNEKFDASFGSYFYSRAAPDSTFAPSVADSNRIAFSFGGNYKLTKNIEIGLAYLFSYFLRNHVDNNLGGNETATSSVDGTYDTFVQILSGSVTYRWDGIQSET